MKNFRLTHIFFGRILFSVCIILLFSCSKNKISEGDETYNLKVEPATSEICGIIEFILKDFPDDLEIRIMEILPNDPATFEFLNDRLLLENSEGFEYLADYLNEFQKKSTEITSYSINKTQFPNVKLIEEKIHLSDLTFEEKHNLIDPYLVIYSPLISDDGKLALVPIDEICFGLCGSGYTLILSKGTVNWEKIGIIYLWVS